MIVGGTKLSRRRLYGSLLLFSEPSSSKIRPGQTSPGSPAGKKPTRGVPEDLGWWKSDVSLSSIPFLEPAIRRSLYISPMLGSILHLHQITFALSILNTPESKQAQKELIAKTGIAQTAEDPLHRQAVLVGLADPDPWDVI